MFLFARIFWLPSWQLLMHTDSRHYLARYVGPFVFCREHKANWGLLLLGPRFFPIILFGSTTLLTGMTAISLHMQWPLTSPLPGSVSQREQLVLFRYRSNSKINNITIGAKLWFFNYIEGHHFLRHWRSPCWTLGNEDTNNNKMVSWCLPGIMSLLR
jgi:hypothetical protein